jgi:cupin superfamily acireductone dioxygenase involved in methionine salvage
MKEQKKIIMQPKTYRIEKIENVAKAMASAPPLPKKTVTQEQVLKNLSAEIKKLHFEKNYEPNDIVELMKNNGIKVSVKEIKNIINIIK